MDYVIFDIETTGLDPTKDRITAIGVRNGFGADAIVDKDEKYMLKKFWEMVKRKYPYLRLVGFNCLGFDMPFILVRSFKHNVKILDIKGKVIDLRYVLAHGNKFQKGKLEEYAKLIGLDEKYNNYDGADAIKLWESGQLSELKEYVLGDVHMTYEIYERAKGVGLI